MSWKISGACWDLDLPANKLLVLIAMADHADHEANNVFPSMGLIAWKTGYSERQVRRIVKMLVDDGILVERVKAKGAVTRYSINLSAGKQKPPRKKSGQNDPPDKMSYPPGQNVLPTPDIQMSDEQSLEPINNHIAANAAPPVSDEKPTATPKPRNPLFDTVATYSFGLRNVDVPKEAAPRIGKIVRFCRDNDVTVDELISFYAWYAKTVGAAHPRDVAKFAEHMTAYRATKASRSHFPPGYIPVAERTNPLQVGRWFEG